METIDGQEALPDPAEFKHQELALLEAGEAAVVAMWRMLDLTMEVLPDRHFAILGERAGDGELELGSQLAITGLLAAWRRRSGQIPPTVTNGRARDIGTYTPFVTTSTFNVLQ